MVTITVSGKRYELVAFNVFSKAELRELACWFQAMTTDEAARQECRTIHTVRSHRRAIREKTGQSNGIGVLMWCLSHGHVRPIPTEMTQQERADWRLRSGDVRFSRTPAISVDYASRGYGQSLLNWLDIPAMFRRLSGKEAA